LRQTQPFTKENVIPEYSGSKRQRKSKGYKKSLLTKERGKNVNINFTALFFAASGLIGYFLILKYFPTLTFERLLFLVSFELPAVFLYYWDRRQKRKKALQETNR
jgi:hypothetical protein